MILYLVPINSRGLHDILALTIYKYSNKEHMPWLDSEL